MRWLDFSLQRKLLVWLMGPLLVLLVLDTVITSSSSIQFSNQAYDRSLQEIAREVLLQVRYEDGRPRLNLAEDKSPILFVDQDDHVFYQVLDDRSQLISANASFSAPPAQLWRGGTLFYNDVVNGEPVRVVSLRASLNKDDPTDTVLVQVAETLNKRKRLARDILASVLIPQLLLVVLASVTVYFGIRHCLRPLQRVREAVSNRSHLDLSALDMARVPEEVRPLLDEVNDLLRRLEKTLNFQNRFIADASHQLKTPVAGIKTQIELMLRETDPEAMRHSVAQLYISVDRLSRLVGQLLSLARNEPAAVENLKLQDMDLNALVLDATMDWVPEAIKRNVDLGFEGAERPVMIKGEPYRLRELVNNLIDNAIRYSQNEGRVTVRVDDGERPKMSISDDGPHIPVEERKRIFERFHRLLGGQVEGSGLGLAIASEIAALHKAEISLEEDFDGIGNTFSVVFPPADSVSAPTISSHG